MCGIAGIVQGQGDLQAAMARMLAALRHRGPDGEWQVGDATAIFGHRRLSIIDLEGGRQPLTNADRSVWLVCNGEIYNYHDLRRHYEKQGYPFQTQSDCELIIALYETHGEKLVDHLRGMFAFALWDVKKQKLILARDHLGQKPLYYARTSSGFAFASEIKSLLACDPSLRELDTHDIVIHLNSFSKVLAPGLRLGWLSASSSIVDQMAIIKQRIDPHTQNLVQFAMARLIRHGSFDAHLKALRAEHARRCGMIVAAIQKHVPAGALRFARPQGGLYLWCRLAPGVSARTLLDRALASGVAFVPGHAFYPDPAGESELRICFSSVLPTAIDEAVRRLAACLPAPAVRTTLAARALAG